MQTRNWVLLAVAAVIGIVAVIIANAWFSGMEQRQDDAESTLREQETVQLVVASQPMEFGTPLTDQNVRLQYWPASSVPEGAFLSVEQALLDSRVATRPMVPGEPVLASKVSGVDGRATLAALLPPGLRAVSLPVDAIRGVGGFVLPGSAVDVILTRRMEGPGANRDDLRSDVLLENVQVLAVDQSSNDSEGEPRVGDTVTLAVSLRDAQRLAVAQGLGTVSLALRDVAEPALSGDEEAPDLGTITAANLGSRGFYIPAQRAPTPVTYVSSSSGSSSSQSSQAAAPARTGPRMVVVRGTQTTSYPVERLGGE
ncbi:Flp pilus assembly protein CpaB [Aurantiacibacter sp. MUD11]|uniref:Flp pilus assembly protein CpaB n=1 Tax=Aurantiacibacter sp. MUD11 TaxID=3003265 RepID=UPI0022AAD6F2|nr:Flp pilus assembly protein CpaB [Aurantiacibacter sp. MUD11]WAT16714.1 Flp pilus assembly protein CpaB [Aurantiacibacter sp. MUD11]